MTVGILFPRNLPKVITENTEDQWKQELAAKYIEVNLLCGPNIKATLSDHNLECWNITVQGKAVTYTLKVCLAPSGNKNLALSVVPQSNQKLERTKAIINQLLEHNPISAFASKISSMLPWSYSVLSVMSNYLLMLIMSYMIFFCNKIHNHLHCRIHVPVVSKQPSKKLSK